ncbi:hypothetical protein BDW69DRAFT_170688 [Aspergillus filifer]
MYESRLLSTRTAVTLPVFTAIAWPGRASRFLCRLLCTYCVNRRPPTGRIGFWPGAVTRIAWIKSPSSSSRLIGRLVGTLVDALFGLRLTHVRFE